MTGVSQVKPILLLWTFLSLSSYLALNIIKAVAEYHFSQMNLDRAIEITPWNYRYRMLRGTIYLASNRPQLAAGEFQATLRFFPYYFDAASNLGVSLAQLGHIPEAAGIFKTVLRYWPEHKESRENLAILEKIR